MHTLTAYPPPRLVCQENQYSCHDGQQCVSVSQACDGVEHCRDGSDEFNTVCSSHTNTSCSTNNGGCTHSCHDRPDNGGVICTCQYGYQLGSDGVSCQGESPNSRAVPLLLSLAHNMMLELAFNYFIQAQCQCFVLTV